MNCPLVVNEVAGYRWASLYFKEIFDRVSLPEEARNFVLGKIADIDKIKFLKNTGVRSISLGANIFDATGKREKRNETLIAGVTGTIREALVSFVAKEKDMEELKQNENLHVEVHIKCKGKKGLELTSDKLSKVAQQVLEDESEGISIITSTGAKIRGDEILLSKKSDFTSKWKNNFVSICLD